MKVRELMTADPQTIGTNEALIVARGKMDRGHFRRLPVVDKEGHLLGILTDGDLREHVGYLPSTRVTAAMIENPVTVQSNATVAAAAELMLDRKIGGLPVVEDDGRLVGIITETDVLRSVLPLLRAS